MKVEPFGERDKSIYFDLKEKFRAHFDPESSPYTQKSRDYHLSYHDLTEYSEDFLVLTGENVVHGVAGLLRSSSTENWEVDFVVTPNSVNRQDVLMLFEALLQLVQKKAQEIYFVTFSDYRTLIEVVQSKGFSPIEYKVDMLLNFKKSQYSPILPGHIVIKPQQDVQEIEEFIRIHNASFKNHFGFEPITLDHPYIDAINKLLEKGEAQNLYAYLAWF